MSSTGAISPNKLRGGYPPQRVFFGRAARDLVEFAGRRAGAPGRGGSIFAGLTAAGDQAGERRGSPASITTNQSLSSADRQAVATPASQRDAGTAELRRSAACLLLIANLRTSATARAQRVAGGPSRRAIGRGGATPSAARAASNIPSHTPCRDLAKSALKPTSSTASERATAQLGPGWRFGSGRETPHSKMGSGVRKCPSRFGSAAKSAQFCALPLDTVLELSMVRVAAGHAVLDLRGNGQTITGRG